MKPTRTALGFALLLIASISTLHSEVPTAAVNGHGHLAVDAPPIFALWSPFMLPCAFILTLLSVAGAIYWSSTHKKRRR